MIKKISDKESYNVFFSNDGHKFFIFQLKPFLIQIRSDPIQPDFLTRSEYIFGSDRMTSSD